jgi:hypothetical protein
MPTKCRVGETHADIEHERLAELKIVGFTHPTARYDLLRERCGKSELLIVRRLVQKWDTHRKMAAQKDDGQAAQNQHYVPKFILRNFLGDPAKEQVHVFSKSTAKGFTTSIKNIMAERRFHEYRIDNNFMANFEGAISRIEDLLLPTYRRVVERRSLEGSPEEKALLATLLAFQLIRTRSQKEQFVHLEQQLAGHLEKSGATLEDVEGYEALTKDTLTRHHIKFIQDAFKRLTQIICDKDFLLLEAPKGRCFYLSDNPVSIHNSQPHDGIYGNLGLACKGIEVYLPLASDLMLCAWCPSVIQEMRVHEADANRKLAAWTLSPALAKVSNVVQPQLDQIQELRGTSKQTLQRFAKGLPITATTENMDFHNSLQVGQAREHIICKTADFELAKRFVKEFPNFQQGRLVIN